MEALIYVHGLSGGHDGGVDESIVDSKLTSICEVWSFADRASEVEAPWLWVSIACGDWPASRRCRCLSQLDSGALLRRGEARRSFGLLYVGTYFSPAPSASIVDLFVWNIEQRSDAFLRTASSSLRMP